MPDPYEELDVFGRPKSRVAGVPYVEPDDDLAALQNYVLNLEAKKAAIESGARVVRKPKEIVREGGRLPGYVHQYEPGYTVAEQERLRDETDPVQFMPIVRQGVGNVQAIMEEGPEKWDLIKDKTFGPRLPRQVNKLGGVSYVAQPATFDERFYGPVPRTEMWPEKMVRSGAALPGDVMSGRVVSGPGLRATDFSDVPGAPNPLAPLIERTQDLAGLAMGGSIPELAARGAKPAPVLEARPVSKGNVAIQSFIDGDAKNAWVDVPEGKMYLRQSRHPRLGPVLDVANIDFETKGTGAFTKYLSHIEDQVKNNDKFNGIRVENIFNKRLESFLERKGFVKDGMSDPPTMVMPKSRLNILRSDDEVGGAVGASRNALKDLTSGSFGGKREKLTPIEQYELNRYKTQEEPLSQKQLEQYNELINKEGANITVSAAMFNPGTGKVYSGFSHGKAYKELFKNAGLSENDRPPKGTVAGVVDQNGIFTAFNPKEQPGNYKDARSASQVLTRELEGGTNVPEATPRNIGRETMPEILARQRASEGYEAAIRDPETKKLYTGMWHEEVLDKIAKDRGVPKDQLPSNLVKGYVNDRGRFLTEDAVERMSQNRSKTAMFRADDEVGAAVAAMNASKAPELKVGQANLPAVIPQGGLPAPGSALNPISNRRGFLRGARDLMAAASNASNANKIVTMAEKLGQTPIPKNPKVPLKEIWKTPDETLPNWVYNTDEHPAWETFDADFAEKHPKYANFDKKTATPEQLKAYNKTRDKFQANLEDEIVQENIEAYKDDFSDGNHGTMFEHHQLPGATNYREHLMQMPNPIEEQYNMVKAEHNRYGGFANPSNPRNDLIPKINELERKQVNSQPFYGDWDEPDIIGHSRVNDRQIPGVGKALHIEEIGSQLHEAGAKAGYGNKWVEKPGGVWQLGDREIRPVSGKPGTYETVVPGGHSYRYNNLDVAKKSFGDAGVPDLPFKKTYVDLAVNRMLHEAATRGDDAVSWTPHELQKKLYGGDSNKEILPRIEALAKKYGGKIEKHDIGSSPEYFVRHYEDIQNKEMSYSVIRKNPNDTESSVTGLINKNDADAILKKSQKEAEKDQIHVLKLTPEMKRIFGHEDFSFFEGPPTAKKMEAAKEELETLRKAMVAKHGHGPRPWETFQDGMSSAEKAAYDEKWNKWVELNNKIKKIEGTEEGFKLRSDSEAGAAVGALRNSVAPTFYSGLARTIERAPFETGTPSQWMKHLRDTVGARQAEEFEHVGLEDRLGPLAEVKAPVERKAQAALETWKAANKGQRPPKELTDAASNENKRIVEQRLAEKGNEKPLTKAELLAHVASNQPKFKEIVKGKNPDDMEAAIHERAVEMVNKEHPNLDPNSKRYFDYFDEAVYKAEQELREEGSDVKYSDYQLPGGTNYREHLMTMPERKPAPYVDPTMDYIHELNQKYGNRWTRATITDTERAKLRELDSKRVSPTNENFYSSHWDEPNVIVHTRMNDRNLQVGSGPNGYNMKSLHAEEFQSDLHQEGRKKGYKEEFNKLQAKKDRTPQEEARMGAIVEHGSTGGVPNFPFKKSWPDLAIKRWLREAVDNDYDAVSWTPGEAQRDRFQLGHTIDNLHYDKAADGTYSIDAKMKNGQTHLVNRGLPIKEDELSRHFGDAVAEKIKKGEGKHLEGGGLVLDNQNLKVGGEGLVSFYDKTVKGKVEALVEKFGGKVEKHEGGPKYTGPSSEELRKKIKEYVDQYKDEAGPGFDERHPGFHQEYQRLYDQLNAAKEAEKKQKSNHPVWTVKLTPEMKAAIRREGFPLFTAGPVMTPVGHDPFDKKQKPKPKLEPVEHDPFTQPTPDLGGVLNKLISATASYRPRPRPIQNGFGRRHISDGSGDTIDLIKNEIDFWKGMGSIKQNQKAWDDWIENGPISTNVQDRRGEVPLPPRKAPTQRELDLADRILKRRQ